MGRRAAHSWLTFCLTFLQIQFSYKVFNLRSSTFTHGILKVSALCDAMLFSVGSELSGNKCIFWRYLFLFIFPQISVYIP